MSIPRTKVRIRETRPAREPGVPPRAHTRTRAIRAGRPATTMAAALLVLFLSACGVTAVDKRAPEPVTAVTTTPGVGLITVAWQDNSTYETGFVVARRTVDATAPATAEPGAANDSDTWSVLATVAANVTSYEDRDVTLGAEYRYSVTATNDGADATPVEPEAPEPVEVLNGAPVAGAQEVVVAEDGTVEIVLSGSDPEGSTLTYAVVTAPVHGSLTGTAPNLVYTPTPDFHGSDAFTFQVNDGDDDSAVATVSIEVQPENDVPVAIAQSASMDEDAVLGITLAGTDTEASKLTFAIVEGPEHGVLTGEGPSRTYTPDVNYFGADGFSFTVSDGAATSVAAAVSIEIAPRPDAPIFTSTPVVSVEQDDVYAYRVTANDADGDALSFASLEMPDWLELTDHGDGTALVSSVAGRPANEDVGSGYQVQLSVDDGTGRKASQAFAVQVVNVNDAPVIEQGETVGISVDEEAESAPLKLSATDADAADVLVWSLASAPEHGTADLDATTGTVSYTGDTDFFGSDTFVVEVSDGSASDAITVDVTVANRQDLPIAIDDAFTTAEDTVLEGNVLSNVDANGAHDYDPDGDPIHVVDSDLYHHGVDPVNGPSHGSLELHADGTFAYQPAANYFGSDSFVYAIRDDNDGENVLATVTIDITPVDDAPTIDQGDSESIVVAEEATSAPLALSASDVEGDALAWSVDTQAGHGTAHVDASGAVTYTGNKDFAGEDAFVIAVSANGAKDTIAVSVTVENVNDAPVIDQGDTESIATDEDATSAPLALSVTDVDFGDEHVWTIGTPAKHGTASVDGSGSVTYLGDADYHGGDAFTVVVRDGDGEQDTIAIDVTVAPVADAPTVGNDVGSVGYDEVLMAVDLASGGTTSSLLTNDIDADGDAIRVSLFDTRSAMGASVNVVSNGQLSYDPRGVASLQACGIHADTFGYTVKDDTGLESEGVVTVHVQGNCPPIDLTLDPSSVLENEPAGTVVGELRALDPDAQDTHTYSLVSGAGDTDNGTFSIDGAYVIANATFDFEVRSTYSIRVRADDGRGGTYEEALTVTVVDVSECPAFPTDTRMMSFDGSNDWEATLELGFTYEFTLSEATYVGVDLAPSDAEYNLTVVGPDGCALYEWDFLSGSGYGWGWSLPAGANAIILTPADGQSGSVHLGLRPY